jgi:hypothetical protein
VVVIRNGAQTDDLELLLVREAEREGRARDIVHPAKGDWKRKMLVAAVTIGHIWVKPAFMVPWLLYRDRESRNTMDSSRSSPCGDRAMKTTPEATASDRRETSRAEHGGPHAA